VVRSILASRQGERWGRDSSLPRTFRENTSENGLLKGGRENRPAWCSAGAFDAPLVELVGDLGQKRASRGTLKRTWGAPVAPGGPSDRFLAHMVFRPGVDA